MLQTNESDHAWDEYDQADASFRRKELTTGLDAEQLGCSLYELAPGDRSWPYHYHTANEEAMFVRAGHGTLRLADTERPLEAGDYVVFPTDEDGAHRVINNGDAPLRYLMISTMTEPDITVYPDTDRFGVYVGSPPGSREERSLEGYFPVDADVDFWAGVGEHE